MSKLREAAEAVKADADAQVAAELEEAWSQAARAAAAAARKAKAKGGNWRRAAAGAFIRRTQKVDAARARGLRYGDPAIGTEHMDIVNVGEPFELKDKPGLKHQMRMRQAVGAHAPAGLVHPGFSGIKNPAVTANDVKRAQAKAERRGKGYDDNYKQVIAGFEQNMPSHRRAKRFKGIRVAGITKSGPSLTSVYRGTRESAMREAAELIAHLEYGTPVNEAWSDVARKAAAVARAMKKKGGDWRKAAQQAFNTALGGANPLTPVSHQGSMFRRGGLALAGGGIVGSVVKPAGPKGKGR